MTFVKIRAVTGLLYKTT